MTSEPGTPLPDTSATAPGKEALLDLLRDLHLLLEPLLFDEIALRRAELGGDLVERARDLVDLLVPGSAHIGHHRSFADRAHAVGERLDRPHEDPDQEHRENAAEKEREKRDPRKLGARRRDSCADHLLADADLHVADHGREGFPR